ncbi:MAG: YfiR family protein [Acidobacteriota bacterium]
MRLAALKPWRRIGGRCGLAALLTATALTSSGAAQSATAPQLKAAYVFNFALFTEWPPEAVPAGSPLTLCIVNDDGIAEAVDRLVKGRAVEGHALVVRGLKLGATLPPCHVLYVAGADLKRSLQVIETVRGSLVLTVSDAARFADSGGMVQLYVEDGRMRFAVNLDALQRARMRLSSRALGVARIVRDPKD